MKKLLLLLPACLLLFAAKNLSKYPEFDAKKEMVALPSGIWMSKYEVSQARYKQFLAEIPQEKMLEMKPDSTVWLTTGFNDPYAKYYFQHYAFSTYPVVGISHAAANAFCDWMTVKYGKVLKMKTADGSVPSGYRFRLPTEAEWMAAAGGSGTMERVILEVITIRAITEEGSFSTTKSGKVILQDMQAESARTMKAI